MIGAATDNGRYKGASVQIGIALMVALLNLFALVAIDFRPPVEQRAFLSLLCLGNFALLLPYQRRRGFLVSIGFAAVYLLFHLSLPVIEIFDVDFIKGEKAFNYWYFDEKITEAVWIVTLFFIAYCVGAIAAIRPAAEKTPLDEMLDWREEQARTNLYTAVFALLGAYSLVVIFFVLGVENYGDFNDEVRSVNRGAVASSLAIIFSLLLTTPVFAAHRAANLKLFLACFVLWAVPTLLTGMRGYVLIPLVVMAPILSERFNIKVRTVTSAAVAFALLYLIAWVKIYRHGRDALVAFQEASIFNALAEMGGSLRPVYESVRWIENNFVTFYHGETYWTPFERLFLRFVPIGERLPANLDDRLMNIAIVKYAGGNYGFSMAAEAYINFGLYGVIPVGLLVGVLVTRLGGLVTSRVPSVVGIAILVALFYHIRQSFVGTWGAAIITMVAITPLFLLDRYLGRAKLPPLNAYTPGSPTAPQAPLPQSQENER